jgi:hypothetical protein
VNIIGFSLWGDSDQYFIGAVENIRLAKEIYPDWVCRFYIDHRVPSAVVENIRHEGGETVIIKDIKGPFHGMFWRFTAVDDPQMELFISRDCDSRLNYREKAAVDQWIFSDKGFHTMHDHPYHHPVPVLGGMWGVKKGVVSGMTEKIDEWGRYDRKGIDQLFLQQKIWPCVKTNCLRHDSQGFYEWGGFRPFPDHQQLKFDGSFVGEIFDALNNPVKI